MDCTTADQISAYVDERENAQWTAAWFARHLHADASPLHAALASGAPLRFMLLSGQLYDGTPPCINIAHEWERYTEAPYAERAALAAEEAYAQKMDGRRPWQRMGGGARQRKNYKRARYYAADDDEDDDSDDDDGDAYVEAVPDSSTSATAPSLSDGNDCCMLLYGVTEGGVTVALRVRGVRPWVRVHVGMDWIGTGRHHVLAAQVAKALGCAKPHAVLERLQGTAGFIPDPSDASKRALEAYVTLRFTRLRDASDAAYYLRSSPVRIGGVDCELPLVDTMATPFVRACIERGLKQCDWVVVEAGKASIESTTPTRWASTQLQVSCDIGDVRGEDGVPQPRDLIAEREGRRSSPKAAPRAPPRSIAPFLTVSYDGEMLPPAPTVFPHFLQGDAIIYTSLAFYRYGSGAPPQDAAVVLVLAVGDVQPPRGTALPHWLHVRIYPDSHALVEAWRDCILQGQLVMQYNGYGFDDAYYIGQLTQGGLPPHRRGSEALQLGLRALYEAERADGDDAGGQGIQQQQLSTAALLARLWEADAKAAANWIKRAGRREGERHMCAVRDALRALDGGEWSKLHANDDAVAVEKLVGVKRSAALMDGWLVQRSAGNASASKRTAAPVASNGVLDDADDDCSDYGDLEHIDDEDGGVEGSTRALASSEATPVCQIPLPAVRGASWELPADVAMRLQSSLLAALEAAGKHLDGDFGGDGCDQGPSALEDTEWLHALCKRGGLTPAQHQLLTAPIRASIRGRYYGVLAGVPYGLVEKANSSSAKGDNLYVMIAPGWPSVDMMAYVKDAEKPTSASLGAVAQSVLVEKRGLPPDVVSKGSLSIPEMRERYISGDAARRWAIVEYAAQDARIPLMLAHTLSYMPRWVQTARIANTPLHQVLNGGLMSRVANAAATRQFGLSALSMPTDNGWTTARPPPQGADGMARAFAAGARALRDDAPTYTGGLVQPPLPGLYRANTLDFSSLYPSIIISHNLCFSNLVHPRHVGALLAGGVHVSAYPIMMHEWGGTWSLPGRKRKRVPDMRPVMRIFYVNDDAVGVLPALEVALLEERKAVRRAMRDAATDPLGHAIDDAQQLGLKIMANSTYGATGAAQGAISCPPIAAIVCTLGRFMITMARRYAEDPPHVLPSSTLAPLPRGMRVVYGDTDSIMVTPPEEDARCASAQQLIAQGKALAGAITAAFHSGELGTGARAAMRAEALRSASDGGGAVRGAAECVTSMDAADAAWRSAQAADPGRTQQLAARHTAARQWIGIIQEKLFDPIFLPGEERKRYAGRIVGADGHSEVKIAGLAPVRRDTSGVKRVAIEEAVKLIVDPMHRGVPAPIALAALGKDGRALAALAAARAAAKPLGESSTPHQRFAAAAAFVRGVVSQLSDPRVVRALPLAAFAQSASIAAYYSQPNLPHYQAWLRAGARGDANRGPIGSRITFAITAPSRGKPALHQRAETLEYIASSKAELDAAHYISNLESQAVSLFTCVAPSIAAELKSEIAAAAKRAKLAVGSADTPLLRELWSKQAASISMQPNADETRGTQNNATASTSKSSEGGLHSFTERLLVRRSSD